MVGIISVWPALACGTSDADERLGHVEVTLSAVDGEGNTWRLPTGTNLYVQKGNFEEALSLDGTAPVATFSLPVGTFEWQLVNPTFSGDEWPLERVDAENNVDIVNATLANPQPDTFLVLPSSTTSLTLQFDAALGGTISFAKGSVDVDLAVSTTEEVGGTFGWAVPLQATSVSTGSTAPPALISSLPAVGNSFDITLEGYVDAAWEMWAIDEVCAPIAVDFVGSAWSGVANLLFESVGGIGDRICINTGGVVMVFVHHEGAPTTSTFSGLGSTFMGFSTMLIAGLPVSPFDGDNLDLSLLSGTHTSASTAYLNVDDFSNGYANWYSAIANGQVTFSFAPVPVPSP